MYMVVWIFLIGCLVGFVLESLWCRAARGRWESRKGMVIGPFSQVYGFGALLLMWTLMPLRGHWLPLLVVGGAVGGAYEYACSWLEEQMFGVVSWDYSGSFLDIGGRTSGLFCIAWGALGVLLVEGIVPALRPWLRRMESPFFFGITLLLALFFLFDLALSYVALRRRMARARRIPPRSRWEVMLDCRYPDAALARIYPNMIRNPKKTLEKT